MRASLAANVGLAVASTLVCAVVFEAIARRLEKPRPRREVAEYLWDWEERWERDFYTVGSNASGWPPEQQWNPDGLRDRAHPTDTLEGDYRVAFLGDSVTLGAGIEASQAYPQVLQAFFDEDARVDVMNVALWGWSTRQERLAWERIVARYRPDQVVLAVCLNDFAELQNNLSRPPRWLSLWHERSALVRWLVDAPGREIGSVEELFREPDAPRVRQAFELFYEEVRALRRAVEAGSARLDVIVFPFRFQVEEQAPAPVVQERVQQFCSSEGLRCLDLLPALRRLGPRAFVDYDHLSPEGACLVADEVRALLPATPPARSGPELSSGTALEALRDPDPVARRAAARELGRRKDRTAVAGLFTALRDPREAVRWAAARALYEIGLAPEDVARLAGALESDDPYVRSFAAFSLGRLGAAAVSVLPALIEAYRREEGEGRGAAVQALGALGTHAKAAVPVLLEGLRNPASHRRWSTARSLGRIGDPAALPHLIDLLHDTNNHVRVHAAQALGRFGPEAAAAVPALQSLARGEDAAASREAAIALKKIRGLSAAR